jgi:O-antigen ligase
MVGARIGVAVFPVLLGLGYLFYCKFRPIFKWGLAAMGIAGLCVVLHLLPPDIKNRYNDQIRVDLRNTAISAIKEKPVLGWGTWQQQNLITCEERAQNLGIETSYNQRHFHNLYLDKMVQFGIIGLSVLLFLIFWILWVAIREKHFLLLSFILIYIMAFYFEVVLYSARWVVAFMFWFCFLIANRKYLTNE